MTQEDKQLLLKDLCARLPHKTIIQTMRGDNSELFSIEVFKDEAICLHPLGADLIECIRPYLRPMSSMTEEEYNSIDWEGCRHVVYYDENGFCFVKIDSFTIPILDHLNEHHFDFRYLIEKGLALEAPEGMYKTE